MPFTLASGSMPAGSHVCRILDWPVAVKHLPRVQWPQQLAGDWVGGQMGRQENTKEAQRQDAQTRWLHKAGVGWQVAMGLKLS